MAKLSRGSFAAPTRELLETSTGESFVKVLFDYIPKREVVIPQACPRALQNMLICR